MSEAGFFEPRRASPTGFAMVVAMHAAAIGAVLLIKNPTIIPPTYMPTSVRWITEDQPPPEVRPELPDTPVPPRQQTVLDRPKQEVATVDENALPTSQTADPEPTWLPPGNVSTPPADPPPPAPVRREAQIDQRYAAAFQPPYPTSEQRAQNEGTVRIRVTIGTDGRVRAVERVSATNDAFWAVAERQALRHWRFRPATVDGRPVESTKVMTLYFRLADV
jgi:protein TonB